MKILSKSCLLILITILVSCINKHSTTQSTDSTKNVLNAPQEHLKSLDEIKLALLDGRNEKADILLGKPDYKGRIMDNNAYYMVYFNKVTNNGEIKNLLLLINGIDGINNTSPINYIDAINDGQVVNGVANGFIWIKIGKSSITSNSGGLTICSGNTDWSDVRDGSRTMQRVSVTNSPIVQTSNKDSVELINYWHSHKQELSQIDGTYYILDSSAEKITFEGGATTLNLFGQTYIDIILKKKSENQYDLYLWGLEESNALKDKDFNKYSQTIPVATITLKNSQSIFHWYGLYNKETGKKDWVELNGMPSKDYLLKKS